MGGKSYVLRDTQSLFVGLFALFCFQNMVFAGEPAYTIEQIPAWVLPVPAFESTLASDVESEHGYHDQLRDLQINGVERGNTRVYNAFEYVLTNSLGVENFSDINITFDPTYQSLSFHELLIKRGEAQINKLDTAGFSMNKADFDELRLVYDGTQNLSIELDNVQAGDTIRYSYSVTGDNPVFAGNREYLVKTELWTQLDRQHVRILSPSDTPMNRRIQGDAVSVSVKDKLGVQEIIFDQRDVGKFTTENGAPSWHQARGSIVFSDMNSWQDVAQWAMYLYQIPEQASEAVTELASTFNQNKTTRDEQIAAALRWVQEEITYVDVGFVANSQMPALPETTLQRGFGTSQDKAMLFMTLLSELGVESQAALVNTNRGLEAKNYPARMLAFDHVVVQVERNGKAHFIDPTIRGQSGALGALYEPNFGRALIVASSTVDLVVMDDSLSIVQKSVHKELMLPSEVSDMMRTSMDANSHIPRNAAKLKVTSQKQGLLAEQDRRNIKLGGTSFLSKTYLDYYEVLFPSISEFESVKLSDNADNNSTSIESYTINDFWDYNDKVGEHRWLYADEIIGYLDVPKKIENRKRSYELRHPVNIVETWVVPVSEKIRMYLQEATVESDWMKFSKTATINEEARQATIVFTYRTLTNEVAANDIDAYVAGVEEINDHAAFYLQNSPGIAAAMPVAPWNTAKIKFWVVFLGMIYFTGWWLHYMKKYRKTVAIYTE